ncbi:uncharacterized protein LOC116920431 isoform X1 [Daphnia magna]|uniref:uncharacterized protein LOC116920431 isoform X1 n=1 Tax=Daphnia magna TaxID=35525 RepID=UPI001E1BDA75|nr:uncharacterized protein LOC116920431 isoform X1 [Daphnia magna]XP_045029062.1 uncharacterized protein LOC116920431 isoform X1 [Daphnia magna]XP_045029063.1 uncharacterized protein LOC116920431 isoform X1 [Daphnia magna]XP_045029064.1 uncharacterized protein LOC116920431 isoform X1 [Daphnia magna]
MFISTTEGDLSFHRQFKMTAPAPMTHSLIVGRSYGNSQVTMEGKHCKRSMANKKLSYRNPLRLFQQTRYLHIEGTKSAKTCEWCTVRLGRLQLSDWVIIYWQNIGNEDCSCCTCCIITYSKVSVTSWSHEEFLTLLQLIAWNRTMLTTVYLFHRKIVHMSCKRLLCVPFPSAFTCCFIKSRIA